jgi:ribonuclease VapC
VIVDSSALVAIARGKKDQVRLIRALGDARVVRVATPTWFETSIVLSGLLGPRLESFLSGIQRQFAVEFVPFSAEHSEIAVDAWRRYGNGNHPAKLNFCDCISYATAQLAAEPLLFVGNDFAQTDIVAA